MSQPLPVVITDTNGNRIALGGSTLGLFISAPLPVMPTDVNGNPSTLTGATSGAQVGGTLPIVLCDPRGYAYNLPVVVTSNGAAVITVAATTQATGRKGQPLPVCLTDINGNAISISGATLGAFIGSPLSVVLSDYRGYPITITLSNSTGNPIINTFAGNYGKYGTAGGNAGDGGLPNLAGLLEPCGVALDAAGNVYFCDLGNGYIHVINMQGTSQTLFGVVVGAGDIKIVVGNGTLNGYSGDGGAATSAALGHPCYIAFDPSGNMYFCDQQNGAIRKVTPAGIISTPVGGSGGALGGGGPQADGPAQFAITSVATASGGNTVYTGTFNLTYVGTGTKLYIQGFPTAANNGWFVVQAGATTTNVTLNNANGVAQTHAATANWSNLNFPQGIYIDANGNLVIVNSNGNNIKVYNTQGTTQTFWNVSCPAGFVTTIAGNFTFNSTYGGYSGDGGQAVSAALNQPLGLTVASDGSLHFADCYNNVTRKITPAGVISTFAGGAASLSITNVAFATGTSTYTYTLTSGPALTVNTVLQIKGCTSSGNNGTFKITALGTGTFSIANASGVSESESGATAFGGVQNYTGDGGAATSATMNNPYDIRFNSTGTTAYIADGNNNLIRTVIGGLMGTYAGYFTMYGTAGGFGGDLGLPTAAGMFGPVSLAIDSTNKLYITQFNNNIVSTIAQSNATSLQLASAVAAVHGTASQVSPTTINTTNATLLVAMLFGFNAQATITDGKTNSWTYLTGFVNGSTNIRIAYVLSPTVGTGHTFTIGGANASGVIYAVKGPLATAVFDSSTGANGPLTSPFQPGSLTPTAGDFVVAGFANDIGKTTAIIAGAGSDTAWATPMTVINATDEDGGASCLLNASGSALNPTWTTTNGSNAAAIACFKV